MYFIEDEHGMAEGKDVAGSLDMILGYLGEDGEFSVHFVTDDEIKALNRDYREKDEPTDILTFRILDGEEFPSFPGEEKELGDMFISMDAMRRNAAEFSVSEDEELFRLLVHGILHLQGYDHKTNDFSSEPMLIRQEEIIQAIFPAGMA